MENKKKIMLSIGIFSGIVLIAGISYALWTFNIAQEGINNMTTTCLNLEMNGINAIDLQETYPITDEEARSLTPYTFTISNTCNTSVTYNVSLEMMEVNDRLNSKYVAISIDNQAKQILSNLEETETIYDGKDYTPVEGRYLVGGEIGGNSSVSHTISIWLDESVTLEDDAMNKNFISKVVLSASLNKIASVYKESILNGADPVLADNLIPVVIGDNGSVTKADINSEWYSYEKKEWANAIILLDDSIAYEAGETIPEENIESYFVWIPKYSYQLWSLEEYDGLTEIDTNKVHEIPIKFGLTNTNDNNTGECTTPMTSGGKGNCVVGDYMTHPAFISMGTNGLWVGKFETGYKGATSTASAEVNSEDSSKVQIKPNVYSWRNIQVANAFYTSYNYKRELDSHMMKNTEWGSVAYLTNSKYGRCTNGLCEEVRINNNSAYITGYGANNKPTTGFSVYSDYETTNLGVDGSKTYNYKNNLSQVASTTGNYTGVYDMSGGAFEYVMGVMLDSANKNPLSGLNSTSNSGFKGEYRNGESNTTGRNLPSNRYFDTYRYSTSYYFDFSRFIYGDATGELGPFGRKIYGNEPRQVSSWYDDEVWFILDERPWFIRGGSYDGGVGSGLFDFAPVVYNSNMEGFRIVLAL